MKFEEVEKDENFVVALESDQKEVIQVFEELSKTFYEKLFFFKFINITSQNKSTLYIIGNQYESTHDLTYNSLKPYNIKKGIEKIIHKGIEQDLLFWDYNKHINN